MAFAMLRLAWPLLAVIWGRLLALGAFAFLARKTRGYTEDEIHGASAAARHAILPAYRPFLLGMVVALAAFCVADLAAVVWLVFNYENNPNGLLRHLHEFSALSNLALYALVPVPPLFRSRKFAPRSDATQRARARSLSSRAPREPACARSFPTSLAGRHARACASVGRRSSFAPRRLAIRVRTCRVECARRRARRVTRTGFARAPTSGHDGRQRDRPREGADARRADGRRRRPALDDGAQRQARRSRQPRGRGRRVRRQAASVPRWPSIIFARATARRGCFVWATLWQAAGRGRQFRVLALGRLVR